MADGRGSRSDVIGVADDVRFIGPTIRTDAAIYRPASTESVTSQPVAVLVRTRQGSDLAGIVDSIDASLASTLPPGPLVRLGGSVERARFEWDMFAGISGGLAAMSCAIAGLGVYAIVWFGVARRTRELGIRAALGATPGRIALVPLRGAAVITFVGLVVGTWGAAALAQVLRGWLVGIGPFDATTWALGLIALIVVALLASAVPVRRATGIDVAETLRSM